MSRDDGALGFLVNLGALIWVAYSSYQDGYRQACDDVYKQASINEMNQLREEIERLKRNQR